MSEINEFKKILQKHEKRISNLEKILKSKPTIPILDGEQIVSNLIASGFLDKPKKYGELIKELKTQAKFDKQHKHKEILEKFTSEDKLERKIVGHQWRYSKK